MTWAEFVVSVDSHLAVEATRRGLATFRDRYMRNAILDLQRYIRGYRDANYSTFTSGDVAIESQAHLVPMPTGAKPKACYIYSVADGDDVLCNRYRLNFYPWEHRQDLICGRLSFSTWWGCCWPGAVPPVDEDEAANWMAKAYVYTIGPMGRNFLIYPQLTTSTRLVLIWDGYKYDFDDADVINFPEEVSEAVAAYILWKITLNVDKNPTLARLHQENYSQLRLALYRDFQETQSMQEKDEEYNSTLIMPSDPFYGFGPQDIPFLTVVTALEGATNISLQNLPTVSITTPYVLQVKISGELQTWVLMSSTAATDVPNGVMRPNDYNASTNQKVFFQNSI
jgi:hypothetical protein